MATGQRAFQGSTGAVVSHATLGEQPAAPRTIRPDLPDRLEDTILKALEKDRDFRCQTAAELRADLKRVKSPDGQRLAITRGTDQADMVLIKGIR